MKFCTCSEPTSEADKDGRYIWTLLRYIGSRESTIMGTIIPSSEDLGNGVTAEEAIKVLSENNCFDFEYVPNERDTLLISISAGEVSHQSFKLIFRDNTWTRGSNPHFRSIHEELNKGYIEIVQ